MSDIKDLLGSFCGAHWKRLGPFKRAGVTAPIFFIRSRSSCGIGDFEDLKLLIDWCVASGNTIIQLLPANEVGSLFCPYDALSSFALEPAYLSLGRLDPKGLLKKRLSALKKKYPLKGRVDYAIKGAKLALLWEIFKEWQADPYLQADFAAFREVNAYWLKDYALYKVLKFHHKDSAWHEWPQNFRDRDHKALDMFAAANSRALSFQSWLQWQLFRQFRAAKDYAVSKKVLLKGDLPALVSRDSADVWAQRKFFKLDLAAGAPPDMYCSKGQRWGMPTYDWPAIAADDYVYFKQKLAYAANFYDILRVDHVVGLFRIWSIPVGEPLENEGLHGFFDPRDEYLWEEHGRKILAMMIKSSGMLLCAEDLGVIPPVCRKVLRELGIPGNDVQRWVKDWDVKHDFLSGSEYRVLSVAMLSTHDTTNWPAWWQYEAGTVDEGLFERKCGQYHIDYRKVRHELFDQRLSRFGRLRWKREIDSPARLAHALGRGEGEIKDILHMYKNSFAEKDKLWHRLRRVGPVKEKADKELVKRVFETVMSSRAIFCINMLLDWLFLAGFYKDDPYQYRINRPGTVDKKNWSLTMPVTLEELIAHRSRAQIKKLTKTSGRLGRE